MYIELVDSLRCLTPHEDSWLVAAVSRMEGRHIVDGVLGCPVCRREYPVRDGVGWFADGDPRPAPLAPTADAERVGRAAALLGLTDPGGIVVIGGAWTECADALAEMGSAHVVVLDAAPSAASPQEVSALRIADRLPFAIGGVRAVALGADVARPPLFESAVAVLRPRGRLVGPAAAAVPDGMVELARDSADWVAERGVVVSPPVTLRVQRR
jgi:uncharacterized protein YbaR (Trm112 family)